MLSKSISRHCSAPVTVFVAGIAALTSLGMSAEPAQAQDTWAAAVIKEMKTGEQQVSRSPVRVAALGASESSVQAARGRRAAVTLSDADRAPAPRARGVTSNTRVASRGHTRSDADRPVKRRSLSGGGSVKWTASASCLNRTLRGIVSSVASSYGPVTVNSTCRSPRHNRSVGGAPKSMHLSGNAVDFRIHGNAGAVYAYLRGNGDVGGLKHYGGGLFHIDTGARRSW